MASLSTEGGRPPGRTALAGRNPVTHDDAWWRQARTDDSARPRISARSTFAATPACFRRFASTPAAPRFRTTTAA